jgi:aspartate aminotransferase
MAEMVKEFDTRRRLMYNLIHESPVFSAHMPEGAFYMMMNVSGAIGRTYRGHRIESTLDFAALLLENELVAVVPGEPFGAKSHVRLSYATSQDKIRRGLARIKRFGDELV